MVFWRKQLRVSDYFHFKAVSNKDSRLSNHTNSTNIDHIMSYLICMWRFPYFNRFRSYTHKAIYSFRSINGSYLAFNSILTLLVICFTLTSQSTFSSNLSVPAEFVMRLEPPGSNNNFLRPSDIFIDNQNGEVFVADPGKNRVIIFDSSGVFQFEFDGADHFSSPVNIVVDSNGFIYVLGSTRAGRRIFKFDFDGQFIQQFPIPHGFKEGGFDFTCLAISDNNNLYVYDQVGSQVCIFDSQGIFVNSFEIFSGKDEVSQIAIIINSITISNDKIYIPVSSMGMIQAFDLNGNISQSFGIRGNNVGELNFPVEVKITQDNLILVLDKHRINVICFSPEGKFLGEFGGKGSSPGWFYHPTLLEVNTQNQVYVGQIFENKIQLCQIPKFITDKIEKLDDVF